MKRFVSLLLILALLAGSAVAAFAEGDYEEITPGSTGAAVKDLQKRLEDLGYGPIGIDGAYGDGTTKFVREFQERNGLEANGIATAETLKLLYSDDAKSPFHPAVEILRVRTGNKGYISFTFKNNTDQQVDSIIWYSLAYDETGKYYDYSSNFDYAYGSYHTNSFTAVKPGETYKVEGNFYNYSNSIKDVAVCIKSFHTTDGNNYEYDLDQTYFVSSDENKPAEIKEAYPEVMTDEDKNTAGTVSLGFRFKVILPEASTFYNRSTGGHIISVIEDGGCAEKAGLMLYDLVTAIDGNDIFNAHSYRKAMLKMTKGERVTLTYIRSNKEYETVLALDMDALLAEQQAEASDTSEQTAFMNELLQLADLYKAGLLTDEEFAAAKQKLLGN